MTIQTCVVARHGRRASVILRAISPTVAQSRYRSAQAHHYYWNIEYIIDNAIYIISSSPYLRLMSKTPMRRSRNSAISPTLQ